MTYDVTRAGQVVESFLNDDTLQQIFRERKLLYFEEWLRCDDPTERERIHARARAFGDLGATLQAVVNAKLHEQAQEQLERRSQ